jgi:hypothetical protein
VYVVGNDADRLVHLPDSLMLNCVLSADGASRDLRVARKASNV